MRQATSEKIMMHTDGSDVPGGRRRCRKVADGGGNAESMLKSGLCEKVAFAPRLNHEEEAAV